MNEMFESISEVASAEVKVGGEKQRLILTENYVGLHCKKWIFREDTSFIPLNSIDSIFYGWKRYWFILILGIGCVLGGLITRESVAWILGIVFILIFWFYRPHLLLVRSSRESLGGNPISAEESKKFIASITNLLNKRK